MASNSNPDPNSTEEAHKSLRHSLLGPSLLKAGQDRVNQQKVGEIIYNASKGSKFFKHEERRDEQLTKRIEGILKRKKELEALDLSVYVKKVDEQIAALEASRDLSQTIVHVDCDAFYASVEELDRPELKEVPMAVGGGVLTTCNYKAREFGVRSGMAGYIAKQLCPHLIFLPLNFEKYGQKAEEVREVLAKYDPRYEAGSCDEAFLNITKYLEEHPEMTPDTATEQIRAEVFAHAKITVSAGIAPNARLAKIASNQNKPNGQFRIQPTVDAVRTFMSTLPVRKVNGVGRVFERELQAIGINTWGDVHPLRHLLQPLFSEKLASFLLNCHLGLGRTHVHPVDEYERKSIGTESTFSDLRGPDPLRAKLRSTAVELEKDLANAELKGRTVNLKVKLHTYEVYTRQKALGRAICTAEELYNAALPLLAGLEVEFRPLRLRLMGLRMTQLVDANRGPGRLEELFKNAGTAGAGKRKRERDDEGWEVWPEEEFTQMKAASGEQEEDILLLSQHEVVDSDEEEGEETSAAAAAAAEVAVNSKNANAPEQAPEEERWPCPICTRMLPAEDALFNEHVDFCLSRETIKEAVKGSSGPPDPPEKVQQHQQQEKRPRKIYHIPLMP
ncbi:IMS-domain-containing protein [Morchella conica CCBAS932]|uniref:DNA polymerase kappa n=1 Tax=Morchella conica CCBAS932 TaxID=1392247 RepID=A0A3N4KLL3_9PEZI|nr:IMS-domain-containing protein [Morchella conica CCBAS932]